MIRRVAGAVLGTLAIPAVALGHGGVQHASDAEALRHSWASAWSVSWVEVAFTAVALAVYAQRADRKSVV